MHRLTALDKIADFEQAWDVWEPVLHEVGNFRVESAKTTANYRNLAKMFSQTQFDKAYAADTVKNKAYEAMDAIKKQLDALEKTLNRTMQAEFAVTIR